MGWHTCSLYILACIPKNTSLRCILILCTPEPLGEVEGTKELTPPPPSCPTNYFVLTKYNLNGSVQWTRRGVRVIILRNDGNTSLGTRHPADSNHKAMEASIYHFSQ